MSATSLQTSRTAGVPPLAVLALFGSIVTVGAGNSWAQTLFAQIGATGAVALRNLVGAAILLAIFRPFGRRGMRLTRRDMAVIAAYGALLGVMNELFYRSLRTLPIGLAVAIEFTGPLLVAVLGSRRPADFVWVALAILGIVLIAPHQSAGGGAGAVAWSGIAFALAAGAAWAGYMLLGQRAGGSHGGAAAALGLSIATVVTLPLALAVNGPALFAPALWPDALLIGLLASAIPYALELYALARMPARNYGMLVSTEPAISALAGFVLLGQHLNALQMVAIALLITASAGATLTARAPRRVAPAEAPL